MKKNSLYTYLFVALLAVLVGGNYLYAAVSGWSDPTAPPPGNNVAAPLNEGVNAQYKYGSLGINGGVTTTAMVASDIVAVKPAGAMWGGRIYGQELCDWDSGVCLGFGGVVNYLTSIGITASSTYATTTGGGGALAAVTFQSSHGPDGGAIMDCTLGAANNECPIESAHNVDRVVRLNTGRYMIEFSSPLPSDKYFVLGNGQTTSWEYHRGLMVNLMTGVDTQTAYTKPRMTDRVFVQATFAKDGGSTYLDSPILQVMVLDANSVGGGGVTGSPLPSCPSGEMLVSDGGSWNCLPVPTFPPNSAGIPHYVGDLFSVDTFVVTNSATEPFPGFNTNFQEYSYPTFIPIDATEVIMEVGGWHEDAASTPVKIEMRSTMMPSSITALYADSSGNSNTIAHNHHFVRVPYSSDRKLQVALTAPFGGGTNFSPTRTYARFAGYVGGTAPSIVTCDVRLTWFDNSGGGSSPSKVVSLTGFAGDEFAIGIAEPARPDASADFTERLIVNPNGATYWADPQKVQSDRADIDAFDAAGGSRAEYIPLVAGYDMPGDGRPGESRIVLNTGAHAIIAKVLSCTP